MTVAEQMLINMISRASNQHIEVMNKQNELLERIAVALEKIADAQEKQVR